MSDDVTIRELAEAAVCIVKLISLARKLFPDWVPDLLELEDTILDLQQELR